MEKSKAHINKWIEIGIFISIFISSYVFFRYPFEAYLHYPFFLALLPLFFFKYGYPKFLVKIFTYLIVIGIVNIAIGRMSSFSFLKVFGGLLFSVSFYYYAIKYYNYDVKRLFHIYLKWSYYSAVIGIIQIISYKIGFFYGHNYRWLLNKGAWGNLNGGPLGIKINSIFPEPSTLAAVLAPAMYVALYNLIFKKNMWLTRTQSLVIIFVYFASGSSTAYLGVMLSLLLIIGLNIKFQYIVIGAFLGAIMFNVIYNTNEDFKIRVDSSKALWLHQDYSIHNTNTSSFVLYNNFHVATSALKEHPLFGTGLGSYQTAFKKHSLTKNPNVIAYDFEFNTTDGNSLFFRLLVETGLVGTGFFFLLIIRGFIFLIKDDRLTPYKLISQSILILFLLNLLRQGNYFLNGFPFFVLLYYYNRKEYLSTLFSLSSKATSSTEQSTTPSVPNPKTTGRTYGANF